MNNRFIIDWFSFSTKYYSEIDIVKLLKLEGCNFQKLKGMHGYRDRIYFESISIHYNGGPEMGVWCEMSGKGCRAYETYGDNDYELLFKMALSEDINITRLDIAYDDFVGVFNMNTICKDTQVQNYVSKWKSYECIYSNGGNSVLFGSRQSDIIMRIYDKAAEQKQKGILHWIRLELQMRDDRALGFIRAYMAGMYDLGQIFQQVLYNYIRFVVKTADSNKSRWPNTDYWNKFIQESEKLSIYEKPGTQYTMDCLYDFVIKQCGNAVDTFIKVSSLEKLIEELQERGTRPNPKYIKLITEHKQLLKEVTS